MFFTLTSSVVCVVPQMARDSMGKVTVAEPTCTVTFVRDWEASYPLR